MPAKPLADGPRDRQSALAQDDLQGGTGDEDQQDYQDYCVAAEAIDEALDKGGIKKMKNFVKEPGFEF